MKRSTENDFSRRTFVANAAKTFLGLGAVSSLAKPSLVQANSTLPLGGKAKSVIYLYMSGGMSHLDTFDTKPGADTQGPVESIKTSADGVQISQFFPTLAKQMHNIALINSLNSTQGAHAQGNYFMHTSYFHAWNHSSPGFGGLG